MWETMRFHNIIGSFSIFLVGILFFSGLFFVWDRNNHDTSSMQTENKIITCSNINKFDNITLISRFTEGENLISDMVTYKHYVIVADTYDSLKVLDVSDPNNLVKVFHEWPGGRWNGLEVVGDRLYVAHHGDGLQIYDISDPTDLLLYGILWLNEDPPYTDPQDVTVQGSYAYLADDFRGLQVIDVSDMSWPAEVGRWNDGGDAKGVAVEGSYAYVIERSGELEIIDVSDPFNPVEVGNLSDGGSGNNIVVKDETVYIADLIDGLEIINISNPHNPVLIKKYKEGTGETNGIFVNDSLAYLADGLDGLEVLDISNPLIPEKLASYTAEKYATNVHINGSRVYLSQKEGTLDILEIDSNQSPYEPSEDLPPEIVNNRIKMDPIEISSNNDFTAFGFAGDGTAEDPYLLENIYIYNNQGILISISNTNVNFILRNCLLDGIELSFGGTGILLHSVENGYIVNNTVTHNSQGIVLVNCKNVVVSGNQIINNEAQGIFLVNTKFSLLSDNILIAQSYQFSSSSNDFGIDIYQSHNNSFIYNNILNYRLYGLYIESSSENNSFLYNTFVGNNGGSLYHAYDVGSFNNFRYNYWDTWLSPDDDGDGVVDSPYPIWGDSNSDFFPKTSPLKHTLTPPDLHIDPSEEIVSGILFINWSPALDSHNTSVVYSLYFSNDRIFWTPIVTNFTELSLMWNSNLVPNGFYHFKVIAQSSTELIASGYFEEVVIMNIDIDNITETTTDFVESKSFIETSSGSMNIDIDNTTETTTDFVELIFLTPGYQLLTAICVILVIIIRKKRV